MNQILHPSPEQRLHRLGKLLLENEPLWRPAPFIEAQPDWCALRPALAADCMDLSDAEVWALEEDPDALQDWLSPRLPALAQFKALVQLPAPPADSSTSFRPPKHWDVAIPGRKWAQICAFLRHTPEHPGPVLDWCSGKAHLGRTLARWRQAPLQAIERDPALCQAGLAQASDAGVEAHFDCCDVLTASPPLPAAAQVLALHACGDLHRQLLHRATRAGIGSLSLAPCCYHLWLASEHQALSKAARHQPLRLDRNSTQMAMQGIATGSARERRQSLLIAQWRLGFDCLQRTLRADDSYLASPSLPRSASKLGFEAFCRSLATQCNLAIPDNLNWSQFEAEGRQRHRLARRLQIPRLGFRRPLELWLALDLTVFLEENGYAVELFEFCSRNLTPRNLMINARLPR